ncbi:hypothetical protein D3C86_1871550 [compost metagenome]
MGEHIHPAEIGVLFKQRAVQQQIAAVTPAEQGVETFGGFGSDGELEFGWHRLGNWGGLSGEGGLRQGAGAQ